MVKQLLPHLEEIQRRYQYDPETGVLHWRINQRRAKAGSPAGSVYSNGYLMVYVAGKPALAHRVAWVLFTGEEPPKVIDHEDRNPLNNAWVNLRASSMRLNQGNRSPTRGRKLPMGVRSQGNKYAARMTQRGVDVHLGTYSTVAEAEAAYQKAKAPYFC